MKAIWLALSLCCASACIAAETSESAESFPSKPIRWVVPFTPGASTDLIARMIGQRLTETWGKQVIIDNRGGAGGTIGTELAARANPDG
jgi:tripartite-type tricarboxylate transporter receptor subunit TctC